LIPRLAAAVNQLTRTHKARLEVDGVTRFVDEEPLLSMLLNTWKDTSRSSGGGGKASIPLDATCHDLYNDIRAEAMALSRHIDVDLRARTEDIIIGWARRTERPDAADIAENWVACIRSIFEPVKTHHINAPCPACGQRKLTAQALGEQSVVNCECGAQWAGKGLLDLAHMIQEAA
jgi:hypothetical protein